MKEVNSKCLSVKRMGDDDIRASYGKSWFKFNSKDGSGSIAYAR